MSEFERRFRRFVDRMSTWWSNSGKAAGQKRMEGAAAKARDMRDTETGRKAAAKLSDLRDSDTARKAEAKLGDLRKTDTAKKAESAIADLRQREAVKKAEESARKALHDLFPGGKGGTGSSAS